MSPEAGPSSQLKFMGPASYAYISKTSLKGKNCQSIPLVPKDQRNNIKIPANKRLWIAHGTQVTLPESISSCGFDYSFVPKEGVTYLSKYYVKNGKCFIALQHQSISGQITPESSYRNEKEGCW